MQRALASSLVLGALLTATADAQAFGGWMAQAAFQPTEQRVALAVTPLRTTLWTSLRFISDEGPIAIVLPVPAGAALDVSSDAWFEALDVATAPRIVPPAGENAACPGPSLVPPLAFDVAGTLDHVGSTPLKESAVLPDLASVTAWAYARNLTLSPTLQAGLSGLTGVQLFVASFDAPPVGGVTATLRVAVPGSWPTLPLALTAARGQGMLVSTWFLGSGVAQLQGSVPAEVMGAQLVWDAETQTTNYPAERFFALSAASTTVLEAATHDGLANATPFDGGNDQIDAFVPTYFDRAAAYGPVPIDTTSCVSLVTAAFSSSTPVAPSCPRADLGTVGVTAPCVEAPPPGTLVPATLRCGDSADDLAVALSGAAPGSVWVTRQSMAIWDGDHGQDWLASFLAPTPMIPVWMAAFVDTSECPPPPASSQGEGGGSTDMEPGGYDSQSGADVDVPDVDVDTGGCDSSSDSGGSCGGDSGSDGGCSGADVGDGGGDCGGGGGGDFTCALSGHHVPRLAPLLMAVLGLLAPLRRRGTTARRGKRRAGPTPGAAS